MIHPIHRVTQFLHVLVEDHAAGPTGGETALLRIEPAS
jgi:hypothetical protein